MPGAFCLNAGLRGTMTVDFASCFGADRAESHVLLRSVLLQRITPSSGPGVPVHPPPGSRGHAARAAGLRSGGSLGQDIRLPHPRIRLPLPLLPLPPLARCLGPEVREGKRACMPAESACACVGEWGSNLRGTEWR